MKDQDCFNIQGFLVLGSFCEINRYLPTCLYFHDIYPLLIFSVFRWPAWRYITPVMFISIFYNIPRFFELEVYQLQSGEASDDVGKTTVRFKIIFKIRFFLNYEWTCSWPSLLFQPALLFTFTNPNQSSFMKKKDKNIFSQK